MGILVRSNDMVLRIHQRGSMNLRKRRISLRKSMTLQERNNMIGKSHHKLYPVS